MISQTGIAGLLVFLMVLPTDQLLAAHCPMEMEARKQQTANACCPESRDSHSGENSGDNSPDKHGGNDGQREQNEQGDRNELNGKCGESGKDACLICMDCTCALVPHSGDNSLLEREAIHQKVQEDASVPSQAISYTVEETIVAPDPPARPIHRPVPIYLSNQVFLN